MIRTNILKAFENERHRQDVLAFAGSTPDFDATCTPNDWVGFITAYAGRAVDRMPRNIREGATFRENMIKVGALALAAIEAHDNALAEGRKFVIGMELPA